MVGTGRAPAPTRCECGCSSREGPTPPAVEKAERQRYSWNSQGLEKLCSELISHLLCSFPHTVYLDNTAVRQKVSALCCLPRGSLGARFQHGGSLSCHLCINAS